MKSGRQLPSFYANGLMANHFSLRGEQKLLIESQARVFSYYPLPSELPRLKEAAIQSAANLMAAFLPSECPPKSKMPMSNIGGTPVFAGFVG